LRDLPVEPTERERDVADAFRIYLAAHAAQRPIVQKFRREDLPHGRLLTEDEEISEFLAKELKVEPDVDQYLDSHRGRPANIVRFDLSQEPPAPDDAHTMTYEVLAEILAEEESEQEKQMEEEWYRTSGREEGAIPRHDAPAEMLAVDEMAEEGRLDYAHYGSTARWHLEELGEWLVDKYPWENVGDAVVFLISGRPPRLAKPLRASHDDGTATYSITFSSWVSEETILRAYHNIRSIHPRLPGDKTVRVLRFVSEQTDGDGHLPTWDTLLNRWNAANPDDRFTDRSALRKAYRRAVEALVPPYLPLT